MSEINELDSTCGISDDELTERFKEAIRIDNDKKYKSKLQETKYEEQKNATGCLVDIYYSLVRNCSGQV
jgi:hypothetical protein